MHVQLNHIWLKAFCFQGKDSNVQRVSNRTPFVSKFVINFLWKKPQLSPEFIAEVKKGGQASVIQELEMLAVFGIVEPLSFQPKGSCLH